MAENNPFRVDTENLGQPVLACPVCGCHCVHPVGLECRSPGMRNGILSVNSRGITLDPDYEPSDRGVKITLQFLCESGHRFDYILLFHKGSTLIDLLMSPLALPVEKHPDAIWRD